MFKQVFRVAFVALIWKQYKGIIVSTLLLFAYLLLVSMLHEDYLNHLDRQEQSSSSGLSFVYKWLAYAFGIAAYFLFHWWRSRPETKTNTMREKKSASKKNELENPEEDPFANIRKRKNLRSRADFIDGKD